MDKQSIPNTKFQKGLFYQLASCCVTINGYKKLFSTGAPQGCEQARKKFTMDM
jgi:hypothetical protein